MLHFPSKLQKNGPSSAPRHSDLNATQHKTSSHPIFSQIEEELHDARRVHSHGQEEDLRSALIMVIDRVSELSSLLSDAYKTQAELEVQLNVTKSNLQLVIANNDMLEDALKRDSGQSMDIGWHRTKPPTNSNSSTSPSSSDSRFSKFKFTSISPSTRPATPTQGIVNTHHLNSPSMPSLPSVRSKEMDDLTAELEKERIARKTIAEEKSALEDELESLSQALFEEANNMVAAERRMRAETEEELKDLKQEKEALRSALRLIGGENTTTTTTTRPLSPSKEKQIAEMLASFSPPTSRSSSRIAVKSRPTSLDLFPILPPLPPSPTSSINEDLALPSVLSPDDECQPTPTTKSWWAMLRTPNAQYEPSPWSDVTSNSDSQPKYSTVAHTSPT